MRKKSVVIILNFIIFWVFYFFYYMKMSFALYTVQFIPTFIPIGIILIVLIFTILNLIMRQSKFNIICIVAVSCILFFSITATIDSFYGGFLKDYYYVNHYSNLWNISSYIKKQNNLIVVKDLVVQKGIEVTGIKEGTSLDKDSSLRYYLVNNMYYILVDITSKNIIEVINANDLIEKHMDIIKERKDFKKIDHKIISIESLIIFYYDVRGNVCRYEITPIPAIQKFEFNISENKM